MFDDDEIENEYDTNCPSCGHSPIRSCRCRNLGCEDGWIDRYDEDPLWYDENDPEMCTECWGTGVERWCPKCGFDLQRSRRTKGAVDNRESVVSQASSTPEVDSALGADSRPIATNLSRSAARGKMYYFFYRLLMVTAHRHHWHYMQPTPLGDLVWCHWCGLRVRVAAEMHPTDGGLSASDNESAPATIGG